MTTLNVKSFYILALITLNSVPHWFMVKMKVTAGFKANMEILR